MPQASEVKYVGVLFMIDAGGRWTGGMPRRRLLWTFYYTAVVKEERSQEAKALHQAPGLKLFWVLEFFGQRPRGGDRRHKEAGAVLDSVAGVRREAWTSRGSRPAAPWCPEDPEATEVVALWNSYRRGLPCAFNWEGAPRDQNLVEVIYLAWECLWTRH